MNYSLRQIHKAINNLPVIDGDLDVVLERLKSAINSVEDALNGMNDLTVKGRDSVDSLLGCMMATEAIIGDKNDG